MKTFFARSTKWFFKIAPACILCFFMCALFSGCSGKNGSRSFVAEESEDIKIYPSNRQPHGNAAQVYREKLDYFNRDFIDHFTKNGETEKIKGYKVPVTVHSVQIYDASFQEAAGDFNKLYGESFEKNRWTEAVKRAYNIDLDYKFMVPMTDYTQQLRLDLTANDLPDIFTVEERNDLYEMAEAGVIQELGSLMDNYASDYDKAVWNSDNGILLDMGTYNGKLYGLPAMVSHTDMFSYLWIRSDWLEALGLQFPKTFDDLTAIMEAFAAADFDGNGVKDTAGIAMEKTLYETTRGIFSGFGAYPEIWEIKNGVLAWGGISENCRAALVYLNGLYRKGLINKEFITIGGLDFLKDVLNNKCGIFYGGHWLVQQLRKMPEMFPGCDWVCPLLPTSGGKPVKYPIYPNQRGWLVVNSKFKNPEIVYKLFALNGYLGNSRDADWWWFEHGTQSINYQRIFTNVSANDNYETWLNLMEVYANNDPGLLQGKAIPHWSNLNSDFAWEWERMFGNLPHAAMTVLDDAIKRDALFYTEYLGLPSNFMTERWAGIFSEQLVTFTKFITGDLDITTGWDEWVKRFNSMGGERITAEANEWYRNKN